MYVTCSQLGHAFRGQAPLFSDLTFRLGSGDLVAIQGPSGCGKSTLLAILAGWTRPRAGRVDMPTNTAITWVPQNPFGVAGRNVLDHAVLPLLAKGGNRGQAEFDATAVLRSFRLDGVLDRRFSQLSGGEAQRLMLARAVLGGADLVLVDEPTAQLDPVNALSVIDVLAQTAGTGRIVVVATHDPRVAETCTSQLILGLP